MDFFCHTGLWSTSVLLKWLEFLPSFKTSASLCQNFCWSFCPFGNNCSSSHQYTFLPQFHDAFLAPFKLHLSLLFFFNYLHSPLLVFLSNSLLWGLKSSGCSSSPNQLCEASCRRDWCWPGPLRPYCSSWQGCSWELFGSRRIGGSASHSRPRPHAYTHALRHTTPPHSQDDFVCLPPIRPVCFLSPHYETVRGASVLSHFQIHRVGSDVGGEGEMCMNQS